MKRLDGHTIALLGKEAECLRLEEVVTPALVKAGAKIRRVYEGRTISPALLELGYEIRHERSFEDAEVVFIRDAMIYSVEKTIPIIAIPHASWNMKHSETLIK